jgi:hypothetical protein
MKFKSTELYHSKSNDVRHILHSVMKCISHVRTSHEQKDRRSPQARFPAGACLRMEQPSVPVLAEEIPRYTGIQLYTERVFDGRHISNLSTSGRLG